MLQPAFAKQDEGDGVIWYDIKKLMRESINKMNGLDRVAPVLKNWKKSAQHSLEPIHKH